jgi:hypothetical protein
MTFSEDKDPRCSVRFELVKSSGNDCKPAPFSDPIHNIFEVFGTCDPYTVDVSQNMLHSTLRVLYFIYNQTHGKHEVQKAKHGLTHLGRFARLDKVGNTKSTQNKDEKNQEHEVKVSHLYSAIK